MAFKVVLVLGVLLQVGAAALALRLNARYRRQSAWLMISAAAILMAVERGATLAGMWDAQPSATEQPALWAATLLDLLVSVLLVAGIYLIEPLFREIAEAQAVLEREKRRLERVVEATEDELRLARRIQQNLLPKEPPQLAGFEIAGASRPAEWTGGDYFDYVPLHDGSLAVVVGDVSGHGLGPALLMAETRALLRALGQAHADVGRILTLANRALADDVEGGRFVTCFALRLTCGQRAAQFSSAGHDVHVLRRRGGAETLHAEGPPLGVLKDITLASAPPLTLEAGDLVLLMSDGIAESVSHGGEQFGLERALEIVRRHAGDSAREIVSALFQAAHDWTDGPQRDDNTAVVIKVL